MKTRWFNFRPLCVIFLCLTLGSLFGFYITRNKVATIVCLVAFLAIVLFAAISRKKIAYLLLPILTFGIGFGVYSLAVHNYNKTIDFVPDEIEGRVYLVEKPNDSSMRVQLDSCKFNGESHKEKMYLYIYDNTGLYENIEIGSVIKFEPLSFYKNELIGEDDDIPQAGFYSENLKYTASAYMSDLTYIKIDRTFAETIKQYIKNNLHNGLSNENVEIAYSALFGEKEMLSENNKDAYSLAGVAHLMAVSGLHVGIITGVLYKLLDLLKIKRFKRFAVVAVVLLFYAYICNFSVSIVRASIMSLMLILAPLVFREYDTLSAISLAGAIIFFINPFSIFDISFLMSFSCVLGITMLNKPINAALEKLKLPAWLSTSLALSTSTVISLMFIMAYYFRKMTIIALLANIVIIPIFTIVFSITFVFAIVSLILPFATYTLMLINPVYNIINLLTNIFAGIPFANILTIGVEFPTILLYFVILFVLGRICTARKHQKALLCLPLVAIMLIFMV